MKLRTQVDTEPFEYRLDHSKRGLVLGSCFAQNIGARMRAGKMPIVINPFGVLFNPASICSALDDLSSERIFTESDLLRSGDLHVSLAHHSSLCSTESSITLQNINSARETGSAALQCADYIVITLGTAWVYEYRSTGRIVSNCHKLPARDFVRRRLSVSEIVEMFERQLMSALRGKKIIFTVSPIRHLSDGMEQNQLSKSTLILSVHSLCEKYKECCYFPSYEIMMDDLRDYRFYERDMVHPSEVAIDYIWESFCSNCIAPASMALFERLDTIRTAMAHRPLNPQSPNHIEFRKQMLNSIIQLKSDYKNLDFDQETGFFSK